jgi:plasmid maintenance system antidote protein VapI
MLPENRIPTHPGEILGETSHDLAAARPQQMVQQLAKAA